MFFLAFDKFGGSGVFVEVKGRKREKRHDICFRGERARYFRTFVCILGRCILFSDYDK